MVPTDMSFVSSCATRARGMEASARSNQKARAIDTFVLRPPRSEGQKKYWDVDERCDYGMREYGREKKGQLSLLSRWSREREWEWDWSMTKERIANVEKDCFQSINQPINLSITKLMSKWCYGLVILCLSHAQREGKNVIWETRIRVQVLSIF